ncbi:MAG: undecaprenyl diphosphate synthase family protein, partial [Campylobacter sp.]|nr:undecaprenyl diphosphate synthase family protein [Campylobacter sp.]
MNDLNHLAIIMDGNGRWAKAHALVRTKGHEKGALVVEQICEFCIKEKIPNLTLYAFSTENWKRPKSEVDF